MQPTWEYYVQASATHEAMKIILDGLGTKGWELVTVIEQPAPPHAVYAYLKRQVFVQ